MANEPNSSKGAQGGDKAKANDPHAGRAESAVNADARDINANEVRVDASDKMSYKDYAAQFTKPIVTVQRIIDRKANVPKKRLLYPNMVVRHVVIWGQVPKDEPPKPERVAATARTYIMNAPPPRKPPPPGIGSMEPNKG